MSPLSERIAHDTAPADEIEKRLAWSREVAAIEARATEAEALRLAVTSAARHAATIGPDAPLLACDHAARIVRMMGEHIVQARLRLAELEAERDEAQASGAEAADALASRRAESKGLDLPRARANPCPDPRAHAPCPICTARTSEDGLTRYALNVGELCIDLKRELAAASRPLPAQMEELRAKILEIRASAVHALDSLLRMAPVQHDDPNGGQPMSEAAP